jgi:hypothetical protein
MLTRFKRAKSLLLVPALAVASLVALPQVAIASTSYTYDQVGRLSTARYGNGLCIAYSYDANGNRTSQNNMNSGAPLTPVWGTGMWGCISWTP